MKKLIILLFIGSLYANETKEILFLLKNLQKIHYNYTPINSLYKSHKQKKEIYKPIIIKATKISKTYILEVIFNNKVKINQKWYKNGDIIDNYKVVITNNNVFLKNKNKIISLKPKLKVLK